MVDCCEHGNEPLGSIKGREFGYPRLVASEEGLCSMELVISGS
jgi:hypothetical protein